MCKSTPEILTQNLAAPFLESPFLNSVLVAKSPSDSAGVGRRLWKTDPATAVTARTASIRIIGIDPGLRRTGWGVINSDGVRLAFVACGAIVSDNEESLGSRLRQIFDGLQEVLARLSPEEAAIEQTFVNRDASATLKLGQARGIALLVPGAARTYDRRICAERREEDGGRRWPWRQGPDQGHGEMPAAARRVRQHGCRRRARHRHHARAFAELAAA